MDGQSIAGSSDKLYVSRHMTKQELIEEKQKETGEKNAAYSQKLSNCNLYVKPLPETITED